MKLKVQLRWPFFCAVPMLSRLEAVKFALVALVAVHFPEIADICPYLVANPTRRTDATPQDLIDQLPGEVKAADEGEVRNLVLGYL